MGSAHKSYDACASRSVNLVAELQPRLWNQEAFNF